MIVIDPGHGGKDPGAVGQEGLTEKEVVLDISLRLQALLDPAYGVELTREDDTFVRLAERAEKANDKKADIFVSVHTNGFHTAAYGVETFHFRDSEEGAELATCLQEALIEGLQETDRGVKSARFTVLRRTKMPAVLVELPFITTPEYEEMYRDPEMLRLCAELIADGIYHYFEG